jgi:ergothioneine biosynthesis protein EgtB
MSGSAEIRQQLEEVRENTLRLFTQVNEVDFRRQIHGEFSPLGWHLGHIGVFEAYWVLQQCQGEPTPLAAYDHFFSPTDNPKAERMNLPARPEILAYLQTVRERVFVFLERSDLSSGRPLLKDARVFHMLIQHEEQHNETILLILHLLAADRRELSLSSATAEGRSENPCRPQPYGKPSHPSLLPPEERKIPLSADNMVLVPAGPFLMGSSQEADTLDNERPQHWVYTEKFLIDRYPITNGEFLNFMMNGGYYDRSWWSVEGWRWREQNNIKQPLYWRKRRGEQWVEVGLGQTQPLESERPVMCVSWYEADAYARFVGKRLPTEEEWEKAVSWDPELERKRLYPWGERKPDVRTCNFNTHEGGTTPVGQYQVGSSPYGCYDMMGNVWEWTSTWFHPYPGFAAYPYEGYSVPYFDRQHRVLRGGSWATRRHIVRSTFRNWYYPWVREIFAGFRCAKDL